MDKIKSDLVIEEAGEESTPVHTRDNATTLRGGFEVILSRRDDFSYHTVVARQVWQEGTDKRKKLLHLLSEIIGEYLPKGAKSILVVGIGSPSITADSLGSLTASRVITTGVLAEMSTLPRVCVISPGTTSRTGIDTAVIVGCLAREISADCIITVDSLCARSPERLCAVIQVTDHGVTPGSAHSNPSGEISSRTMNCPVISLGVPTVIRAESLFAEYTTPLTVSPTDTDISLDCYASIIAGAINSAIFGNSR